MANKHLKKCVLPLIITDMEIKSAVRYLCMFIIIDDQLLAT